MNNQSRKINSIINSSLGIVTQMVIMIGQFAMQTVFIKTLGAEYLGLNGLFSNVLQFLSLAELGIGGAITFSLYGPIARDDTDQIGSIMKLYKKVYSYIGFTILFFGIALSVAIHNFISNTNIKYIQVLFILFLMNSVVSYFFSYRRTLLMADQRSYIDSTNQAIFKVIQVVLQAIFLTQTHNYVAYLLIQILVTFSSNLVIYFKTNKIYPFLKNNNYPEIDKNTTLKMKKNVVGAISSKIGVVVMYGTDNLLVSKFIGLTMVGIYSNYMLVLNSVVSLLNQLFSPVASSIANYLNDDGEKDASNVFFRYMYIVNALSLLVGFGLTMVINMFIQIWLGKEYLLSNIVLSMLLLNWMINSMRSAVLTFMTALGTYWETRWKSLVESAVNLIVGLVLITQTHLGVLSVVLGSFAANVLVNMWFEPLVLFRKKPSISVAMYIRRYILYVILALLIAVIPLVFNDIKVQATFLNFITVGILSVVGFVFVFGAITFLFPENKYFRNLIRNIVKAKFGKK